MSGEFVTLVTHQEEFFAPADSMGGIDRQFNRATVYQQRGSILYRSPLNGVILYLKRLELKGIGEVVEATVLVKGLRVCCFTSHNNPPLRSIGRAHTPAQQSEPESTMNQEEGSVTAPGEVNRTMDEQKE